MQWHHQKLKLTTVISEQTEIEPPPVPVDYNCERKSGLVRKPS